VWQLLWHGGRVWQSLSKHGCRVWQCVHGVLQLLPMQEVEPPWHPAPEKPSTPTAMPQTFTGALTGAVIVFPDSTGMFPTPVTLPLWLPVPPLLPWPPWPSWEMVEVDPPWQSEWARPATAPETPHTFTGTLTGAVTVLPEPTGMLPTPVTLPLWLPVPPIPPWPPWEMVEVDPPWQPASETPATATAIPHRLTGALIGAVIVFPDSTGILSSPVTLPLPEA